MVEITQYGQKSLIFIVVPKERKYLKVLRTTYEESRSYKDNDRSDKCKIVIIIILATMITIAK